MKSKIFSIAAAFVALFVFGTAQAQNVHFTDVQMSENGLTITGKVAGLGNSYTGNDLTITYGAEVIVTNVCRNPGNGDVVPGQSGRKYISNSNVVKVVAKNGNVTFTLNLDANQVGVLGCQGQGLIHDEELSSIVTNDGSLTFSVEHKNGSIKTGTFTEF